jgi:hypothetical protein
MHKSKRAEKITGKGGKGKMNDSDGVDIVPARSEARG